MTTLLYDHTWPGLLSAIFASYEYKLPDGRIMKRDEHTIGFFEQTMPVHTDPQKARRLLEGLKKKLPPDAVKDFYYCFLSEQKGIEDVLLSYTQLIFSSDKRVDQAFAHPAVLEVSQVARKVHREKHRMEAFVRFRLTADNLFFAQITPDFNVLPVITTHFKNRYADQQWLIYDLRRNYGIYYDLSEVSEVLFETGGPEAGNPAIAVFHESESDYESLWRDYFTHVNITERKNTKLHLQHVPKRYWKFLTEKL